jgi:hypothetical protein
MIPSPAVQHFNRIYIALPNRHSTRYGSRAERWLQGFPCSRASGVPLGFPGVQRRLLLDPHATYQGSSRLCQGSNLDPWTPAGKTLGWSAAAFHPLDGCYYPSNFQANVLYMATQGYSMHARPLLNTRLPLNGSWAPSLVKNTRLNCRKLWWFQWAGRTPIVDLL